MFVLSAENMKKAEESAVANGCDYYTLMEKAGTECARVIATEDKSEKITVLCGKGRNGGDGFVIARKLCEYGFGNVFVVLVNGEPTDELCVQMYEEMKKYPVNVTCLTEEMQSSVFHIKTAGVIVEAIFGIGFRGSLSGNSEIAVCEANKNLTAKKYAIDIPAGLPADGEFCDKLYFTTDVTLTMIALKPVQVLKPVCLLCGKTFVMDIGVRDDILEPFAEKYISLTAEEAVKNIKKRKYDSHKGCFGNVLTICGSRNMTGCVYLCNQAAVEIGAGLVTAAFPEGIYGTVTGKLNEPLMLPLKENKDGRIKTDAKTLYKKLEKSDVVAVGCGIGVDNDTKELVRFLIENCKTMLILDADALNCIASQPQILKNAQCDIIITPHPGEMARITGSTVPADDKGRIRVACEIAETYSVTVLLKGANTVIAGKDGRVAINTTGNPSMARGGSGDVLTGLIAGLIPQCSDVFSAVCTAAYIHGAAADYLAGNHGMLSATPTRIIENIHKCFM